MVATLQTRAKTLVELVELAHFYLSDELVYDQKAIRKFLTPETVPLLRLIRARLAALPAWDEQEIEKVFAKVMQEAQCALGKIAQPVRVALTGGTVSPGIFEVLAVLGRERTLARLDRVLSAPDAALQQAPEP